MSAIVAVTTPVVNPSRVLASARVAVPEFTVKATLGKKTMVGPLRVSASSLISRAKAAMISAAVPVTAATSILGPFLLNYLDSLMQ